MPKDIHTPRAELICGKLDEARKIAEKIQNVELCLIIDNIRNDAGRMEAKLVSRKNEASSRPEKVTVKEIDLKIAQGLLEYFGGADANVTLVYWKEGHSGEGYYCYCTDYPEEGAEYLGMTEDQTIIKEMRELK